MTPRAPLALESVQRAARWLREALTSPSDLDDTEIIDSIHGLEELVCLATAAQAQLTAAFDESQRAGRETAGVPPARRSAGIGAQIAHARRESPHRGQQHLALARVLHELPHTWEAWRAGCITEWTATVVARETACLTLEDRLTVDRLVAAEATALEAMGRRELIGRLRSEAERLDPASVVARRRRAESERRVTLRPAPDTMTWLTALLPVKDGVAAYAALIDAADRARAVGDPRSRGQVMADALTRRVMDGAPGSDDIETPEGMVPGARPAAPITLGVVMTDSALFSGTDDPAHLESFGPIPAELARELVADALTRDERVWLRRLYARSDTGELVAMDSRSRLFAGSLHRFIRLRDQVCRTPWCDAPTRHVDHVVGHANGGATAAENAQALCESCNYAKQAPGWHARPSPHSAGGHEVTTTMPTGHTYRSRAPALATIRTTPLRIDYVLTG